MVNVGQLFVEIQKEKVMSNDTANKRIVLCQCWEESERGWGTRPDGYSLHRSEEDLRRFIRRYWDSMPDDNSPIPYEYSRPVGDPYLALVSKEFYDKLLNSENPHGCWIFGTRGTK